MFDYFEYVKFPEAKNIKMIYPRYREEFYVTRNPSKFYLNDLQLQHAKAIVSRFLFSTLTTGTYITLYYYFVRHISKFEHSRCNYILLRQILPSSVVLLGLTVWIGNNFLVNKEALRRHYLAEEKLNNELDKDYDDICYFEFENEILKKSN